MRVQQIASDRSAYEWFLMRENIHDKPSYQREGNLWPERNQTLLINSMINGFDVPKIYFADFSYGDSKLQEKRKLYSIIDGKQRLGAIFKFFLGELRLDSTPVYANGKEYNLSGFDFNSLQELHPELAEVVQNFGLTVMGVVTNREEDLQEMFIRLNLNTTISGPEMRNAMRGPIPQLIRNIALHKAISRVPTFESKRGQRLDAAAKLLYIEEGLLSKGIIHSTRKKDIDKFVQQNERKKYEDFSKLEESVLSALDDMLFVFDEEDKLISSKNFLIIYYLLVKQLKEGGFLIGREDFRNLLLSFEEKRAVVRRKMKQPNAEMDASDTPYVQFNNAIRSPDNADSIERMVEILKGYCTNSSSRA